MYKQYVFINKNLNFKKKLDFFYYIGNKIFILEPSKIQKQRM